MSRHNRDKWYVMCSDHWQYRRSLAGALVWAIQQALKGVGTVHPDSKRTRKAKARAVEYRRARALKHTGEG